MRVLSFSALTVSAAMLVGACSADAEQAAPATSDSSAQATTTTDATLESQISPPAAGEPESVAIAFGDGQTFTEPVTCSLEPAGEFATTVDSEQGANPTFGLTLWTDPDRPPEAMWRTDDESWLAGAAAGTDLDVAVDGTTITATAVFKDRTGQRLPAALTIACAG